MTTANSVRPPAPGRALTRWSAWGLVLLVPSVLAAAIATLATEQGTRCFEYNECRPIPGALTAGCLITAVGAGVAALVWPRRRWTGGRTWAVVLQWSAQVLLVLLVLSSGA
ncbi:hypothetical protein FB563_1829 [Streptomyces puniciscabiei]|uniref:Transmembrane protein n=1 Tax=Streptomyces puniciscabiei TaxID=164348 RepID=A0A542UCV6_9ACTN|nr:hypothetical protein [Streptomyces puniciscabiei]TQK96876.1 hypothetical protein FB563_1829 [Streptomyces puniciscabiei]